MNFPMSTLSSCMLKSISLQIFKSGTAKSAVEAKCTTVCRVTRHLVSLEVTTSRHDNPCGRNGFLCGRIRLRMVCFLHSGVIHLWCALSTLVYNSQTSYLRVHTGDKLYWSMYNTHCQSRCYSVMSICTDLSRSSSTGCDTQLRICKVVIHCLSNRKQNRTLHRIQADIINVTVC